MSERINKPTDELNLLMQFLVKTEKKTQERNFYCLPFDCGIDVLYDLEVITSLWLSVITSLLHSKEGSFCIHGTFSE